jgi:Kef-type K+ transport system membrane component KefB
MRGVVLGVTLIVLVALVLLSIGFYVSSFVLESVPLLVAAVVLTAMSISVGYSLASIARRTPDEP